MEFSHFSVMLPECIEGLRIRPDGVYIDGTAGGAGHSSAIASRLSDQGILLALDQDPDAIETAKKRLEVYPSARVIQANFSEMRQVAAAQQIENVDGVLLDLGVSSFQLDTAERGFSYMHDGNLDMRMSKQGISAREIVNTYSKEELERIFREYGEERFSGSIAAAIVRKRQEQEISTTFALADIIKSAMPAKARREKNPCKRTFQALRIAVNAELDRLSDGLDAAFELLAPGGRLVVLTFHSLEDRIVKQRYQAWCQGCVCPPDFPVCRCGHQPKAKLITRKPLLPSETELAQNKRSQSAKLRILEKL